MKIFKNSGFLLLSILILFIDVSFAENIYKPKSTNKTVRVSVVTQQFNDKDRTLDAVIDKIDQAAADGADIVLLPMECIKSDGESIPGPISNALAWEAQKYNMYIVGNIKEKENGKTYVTSFLCGRDGRLIGKYRKSHKMPDEDMDLGDYLPVFDTDFGAIAMRIGTDRYFVDIDHVYTAKGARMIFWSQMPEPIEDEYQQDTPSMGRAADYNVFIACARYSNGKEEYITNKYPPYLGMPLGRSYIINREGMRIACTPRTGGGIATAVIPKDQLKAKGRTANPNPAFSVITEPVKPFQKPPYAKRKIRATAIEDHVSFDQLLPRLDEAGRIGSDIVCTYEFVWIPSGKDVPKEKRDSATTEANRRLKLVAEKARQYNMYIVIAGVIRTIDYNEALVFDRHGELLGRYSKMVQTHDEQIVGTETPVFDTDFGRIGVRICADEWLCELDRSFSLKGAEMLLVPTQSWGPDAIFRDLRDFSRAMDTGMFHVEATHCQSEFVHRSLILEPTGIAVAQAEYYTYGSIVSAVIDLDHDRPQRFIRKYTPYTPHGYLPEYQPDRMPKVANDLQDTIRKQRRPELYQTLAPR